MTGDAAAAAEESLAPAEIDLTDEDPEAEAARRAPYVFDEAHLATAAKVLDRVFGPYDIGGAQRGSALRTDAEAQKIGDPLLRELVFIAEYRLRRGGLGETGCEIEPQRSAGTFTYPPAIRDVPDPVVRLWRALLAAVASPAARARLADLLLTRRDGNVPALAEQATDAYFDYATGTPDPSFDAVDALLRGWTLARRFNLAAQSDRARSALLTAAAIVVATGERPGSSVPMLAALDVERPADPATDARLGDLLARAMTAYADRSNIVAKLATLRRGRATTDEERRQVDREEAESALALAEASTGPVRLVRLQDAIRVAQRCDVPDVRERATVLLQRIEPAELGLQPIVAESSLPLDAVTPFLAPFTMSPDWRDGLEFFLTTDSPMGSLDWLREAEQEQRDLSFLSRFLPTQLIRHDALPSWAPPTEDARVAHEMAQIALMNAETFGGLLADGLRRFADEYGPVDAEEVRSELVARWGCDGRMAGVLARALGHFWRGDYEACAYLVVPQIEAAMRALLRELDEAIFKQQVGHDPGSFPGMYVMLRALTDLGLDEDWAYFLKTLLLEPPGLNLRNNLAHGSLPEVGPTYASLALRAAALLIVLVPPQPGHLGEHVGPPGAPALVTDAERIAARAALLGRLGVPVPNTTPFPRVPLSAGTPSSVRSVARFIGRVRRMGSPSRGSG